MKTGVLVGVLAALATVPAWGQYREFFQVAADGSFDTYASDSSQEGYTNGGSGTS